MSQIREVDIEYKTSVDEFSADQLAHFDSAFAPHTVDSIWWKLLDRGYSGIDCTPLHVFFYDKKQVLIAILSAHYFPKISFTSYFNHEQLPKSVSKLIDDNFLSCLMIHAFTSVSSIWVRDKADPLDLIDQFVEKIQYSHILDIIVIRNLTTDTIHSDISNVAMIKNDWWYAKGQTRYTSNFNGCDNLQAYLLKSLNSDNRRKVNASIRKFNNTPSMRILRIQNISQLKQYNSQLITLKINTYERNKSKLSIPLIENDTFFEHCFELYGNDNYLHLIVDNNSDVVGYSNAIARKSQARGISLGIKYPEGKIVDTWFNLMMHSYTEFIMNGITNVNLGLGHDHIKRRIGSRPIELKTAIKFTHRFADSSLSKLLAQAIRPI